MPEKRCPGIRHLAVTRTTTTTKSIIGLACPVKAAAVEQHGLNPLAETQPVPPKGISAYGNATYVPRHAKLSETLICQHRSVYTSALPAVGELISFHTLELHWQTL